MQYILRDLSLPLQEKDNLFPFVKKAIGTSDFSIEQILRRSLDARQKNKLKYIVSLRIQSSQNLPLPKFIPTEKEFIPSIKTEQPFIVGAGPAGLFAALAIVENGSKPVILEQGEPIAARHNSVKKLLKDGILNFSSNIQFGEGGAGTFSDGKLTARTQNYYSSRIFELLVGFGADASIGYDAHPHLGTDGLRKIIGNIRTYLEEKGATFHFSTCLNDFTVTAGKIKNLRLNERWVACDKLILAPGNAARSLFFLLAQKGIALEPKPFAVGFRIEHLQEFINHALYGKFNDFSVSGPANYRLTDHYQGRGVYSFCMCPGGMVINGSSEKNGVCVNGMSYANRAGKWANSAIVAQVDAADYGTDLFAGLNFQRKIEMAAFRQSLSAPVQRAEDFISGKISSQSWSSYRPATYFADLNELFPQKIARALAEGLRAFDRKIPGFIKEGYLTAPETRTSSPLRILRDKQSLASVTVDNLFPIGEGAGYAGGIISSAADGYKTGSMFFN